jgi:hypothetical protein
MFNLIMKKEMLTLIGEACTICRIWAIIFF